jgi:sulfur carrier protein
VAARQAEDGKEEFEKTLEEYCILQPAWIPQNRSCYAETVELLSIQLNGHERSLPNISSPSPLDRIIAALELKSDRIAVEHNGEIVPRAAWPTATVRSGDKLEIVHFVGGGA